VELEDISRKVVESSGVKVQVETKLFPDTVCVAEHGNIPAIVVNDI